MHGSEEALGRRILVGGVQAEVVVPP